MDQQESNTIDQQLQTITVDITKLAYKKAMLHACKYPTDDVIGLLIGQIGNKIDIQDAQPLFHSNVTMAPLEIALDLVSSNLKADQKIIGIYEARAITKGTMSDIATEILNNIQVKQQNPILLRIIHVENDDNDATLIAKPISLKENQLYKISEASTLDWNVIEESLTQGLHWKIIDFDAHLENASLDYRNVYLE